MILQFILRHRRSLPSLLFFLSINCFAQTEREFSVSTITKATFFNPGISYETKIGQFQSIYGQAFMNTSFGLGYSSSLKNTSFIYFDPALTLQYRYYYNFKKREGKGKRTKMNSLNYVSSILQTDFSKRPIADAYYPESTRRPVSSFGLAWGFQRNYRSRFSLDLNLGIGYLNARSTSLNSMEQFVSRSAGQLATIGQLNLGIWLNRRK